MFVVSVSSEDTYNYTYFTEYSHAEMFAEKKSTDRIAYGYDYDTQYHERPQVAIYKLEFDKEYGSDYLMSIEHAIKTYNYDF